MAKDKTVNIWVKVKGNAEKQLKEVSKSLSGVEKSTKALGVSLKGVAVAAGGLVVLNKANKWMQESIRLAQEQNRSRDILDVHRVRRPVTPVWILVDSLQHQFPAVERPAISSLPGVPPYRDPNHTGTEFLLWSHDILTHEAPPPGSTFSMFRVVNLLSHDLHFLRWTRPSRSFLQPFQMVCVELHEGHT